MDKLSTRKALVQARLDMPDRLQRADLLQRVMRIWLVGRSDAVIGNFLLQQRNVNSSGRIRYWAFSGPETAVESPLGLLLIKRRSL